MLVLYLTMKQIIIFVTPTFVTSLACLSHLSSCTFQSRAACLVISLCLLVFITSRICLDFCLAYCNCKSCTFRPNFTTNWLSHLCCLLSLNHMSPHNFLLLFVFHVALVPSTCTFLLYLFLALFCVHISHALLPYAFSNDNVTSLRSLSCTFQTCVYSHVLQLSLATSNSMLVHMSAHVSHTL